MRLMVAVVNPDTATILKEASEQTNAALEAALADMAAPTPLVDAMRYSIEAGGKRLRPALVLESFAACRGEQREHALTAAAAIELIHTFSLVHDDLPAMDNDDLRRGKPTNHKVYGEAMAILAGDGMMCLAFELLAKLGHHAGPLCFELANASGPAGMVGGQVLDISSEQTRLSLDELQRVHRSKTGALIRCACRMGAIAADASDAMLAALTQFGESIGLAFQIVDDILDETSTPQQMGKATNKDAAAGKNTYPTLLGLEAARTAASDALNSASSALDALSSAGGASARLRTLAEFVVARLS